MARGKRTKVTSRAEVMKAPYDGRISRVGSNVIATSKKSGSDRENTTPGEIFIKKTWHVHRVTPLQKFSYNSQKLQDYSKILASLLEMGNVRNCGVHIGHHKKYRVSFSILKGFASSEADNDAVEINVRSSTSENDKSVFIGILLSVNYDEQENGDHLCKRAIHLPLFLTTGMPVLRKIIFGFLQDHFKCYIDDMSFSSVDLFWMFTSWSRLQKAGSSKPYMLEYALPYKELHTIQYSISPSSIADIWARIQDTEKNVLHGKDITTFINCLEKHFYKIFSIELSNFKLRSIGTPIASVHGKGAIKIFEPQDACKVLQHLTGLSRELNVI